MYNNIDDVRLTIFAPGCAMFLYKPALAEKISRVLNDSHGKMETLMTCCQHDPKLAPGTRVINICPGCDKRFANDYPGVSTISLWEVLADHAEIPLPDHTGKRMTILDACPTRENDKVHDAIRKLLGRMNIELTEPAKTRRTSTCCGDTFYGVLPVEEVKEQMKKRASEMPEEEVVVYCISCIKSVKIGGKRPQYLVDLLFGEETEPGITDPDAWHGMLSEYIEKH